MFDRLYKLSHSSRSLRIIRKNIPYQVAWIHCFVYISNGVVTRGYIHLVFIIFVLESMLLRVVQVVLLLLIST